VPGKQGQDGSGMRQPECRERRNVDLRVFRHFVTRPKANHACDVRPDRLMHSRWQRSG
jgi:hypothetical protein